ncbi:MAG: hypothetical protein ACOZIN_02555 [Myxococcota bacterium]
MRSSAAMAALLLAAGAARAQEGPVRLHVEPGFSFQLNSPTRKVEIGGGGALKLELPVWGTKRVSPQLEVFGLFYDQALLLDQGTALGGGVGARVRLIDSEYWVHSGGRAGGQGHLFGNLWFDAHPTWSAGGLGFGFDAALGAALNVAPGFQAGPFVKFALIDGEPNMLGGLTFSWVSKGKPPRAER